MASRSGPPAAAALAAVARALGPDATARHVVPPLVAAGRRVIVPYLRGYGPTRFLREATPRSGEQAALGKDLLDLLDALAIPRAVLAGFDWGGRAACVVAAPRPSAPTPRR